MKSIAQTLYETCKDGTELKEGLKKHWDDFRRVEFGIETLGGRDGRAYSFHNGNDTYTFKDGSVLYTRYYKPHGFKVLARNFRPMKNGVQGTP